MKYICVAPDKEMFNIHGDSLGMQGERALYWSQSVGNHRVYRSAYPKEPYYFRGIDINKDLKLFEFTNKRLANNLCKEVNKVYGDNFEVRKVEE